LRNKVARAAVYRALVKIDTLKTTFYYCKA
jgi:hypothetical protein